MKKQKRSALRKLVNALQSGLVMAALCTISSCSSNEENEIVDESARLKIEADLSASTIVSGRYAGSDINDISFAKGDNIGLFINGGGLKQWTLGDDTWEADEIIFWPDKENTHTFNAFYPYIDGCSNNAIPLPSLKNQDGSFANLSTHDFLVASRSANHTASGGKVSFTGEEHSFKHMLSLIKFNLIAAADLENATVKKLTVSSPNLFSSLVFSFDTKNVSINTESEIDEITINPNLEMNGADKSLFIISNPKNTTDAVTFTLTYTMDGKNEITKTTTLSQSTFVKGFAYIYNIRIKDGDVIIDNPQITDWDTGTKIEDIYI